MIGDWQHIIELLTVRLVYISYIHISKIYWDQPQIAWRHDFREIHDTASCLEKKKFPTVITENSDLSEIRYMY